MRDSQFVTVPQCHLWLRRSRSCRPQAAEKSAPRKHHHLMVYFWCSSAGIRAARYWILSEVALGSHPEQLFGWSHSAFLEGSSDYMSWKGKISVQDETL